ncbi:MAG: helix-turn-helix domain-containing protein [Ardenticatenaceae bacterium]
MFDGHEVLTVNEAAKYLRVDVQAMYRLLQNGKCPGVKVGKSWRIRKADLDDYLRGSWKPEGKN